MPTSSGQPLTYLAATSPASVQSTQALHAVAPPDVAEDIAAVQRQLAAVRFSSSVRQEQLTAALLEVRLAAGSIEAWGAWAAWGALRHGGHGQQMHACLDCWSSWWGWACAGCRRVYLFVCCC